MERRHQITASTGLDVNNAIKEKKLFEEIATISEQVRSGASGSRKGNIAARAKPRKERVECK
jgi:hypothetical protein